ncbi:MAG: POTRA domain-containing protein [Candidatus Cloacimonadota bacterium]|nr:POTRA domain-containing protein [Candidatus Cloacimonadota bacterium]
MKAKILLLIWVIPFSLAAQVEVEDVSFVGNKIVTDEELNSIISLQPQSFYSEKKLEEDAQRISRLYDNKGLFFAKVLDPKLEFLPAQKIKIIFPIQENADIKINSIEFKGNSYISSQKIKENIILVNQLKQLPDFIKQIVQYYNSQGFLFAKVQLESVIQDGEKLEVILKITENKPCKIKNFKFRGNKVTSQNTIIRLSGLQNYELITPELINLAENNIEKEEYIEEAEIIPLNSESILINIKEDKMTRIAFLLGYDNSSQQENSLTGFVDLRFMNLYGTGRSLSLDWRRLLADRSSVELSYHETGLEGFPVSADLSFFREEVDSTYIDTSIESEIYFYDLKNRYGLILGWRGVYPGSRRPKLYEKTDYTQIGALWNYKNLDKLKNPSRGNELELRYLYIIDKSKVSNNDHHAVEFEWAHYLLLKKRIVASLETNIKIVENKGLTDLDYYDMGGYNSLRGFREKEFYGFRTSVTSLELRYLLSQNSRTYLFFDHGYVENNIYRYGKLFGFGIGLRLQTRLGIFHLDYGLSYKKDKLTAPMQGLLHFGIEGSF